RRRLGRRRDASRSAPCGRSAPGRCLVVEAECLFVRLVTPAVVLCAGAEDFVALRALVGGVALGAQSGETIGRPAPWTIQRRPPATTRHGFAVIDACLGCQPPPP